MPTQLQLQFETIGDLLTAGVNIVEDVNRDREKARTRFQEILKEKKVQTLMLEWATDLFIDRCIQRTRLSAFHAASNPDGYISARIADGQASASYANLLMEQEVRPGLPLRDCKKGDLQAKAKDLREHARGTLKYALFLEIIEKRLHDKETVGKAMKETDVRQIMVLAQKQSEAKV